MLDAFIENIAKVGFPIAMVAYMAYFQHEIISKLKTSVEKNTEILESLRMTILLVINNKGKR